MPQNNSEIPRTHRLTPLEAKLLNALQVVLWEHDREHENRWKRAGRELKKIAGDASNGEDSQPTKK